MVEERISNLKWTYRAFPPRTIKREVLFSLVKYNSALYFVNGSDEILNIVASNSFGFIEDDTLEKNPKFYYENIKPNKGVKVEEYDDYYDCDFLLGLNIFIESKRLGKIKIQPSINKGGVKPQELAFKDISIPRGVIFQNITESIH